MNTEIMLDLETMGLGPDAAIVAIGAVAFDTSTLAIDPCKFFVAVDLESSVRSGGVMDASTVMWWMQQDEVARRILLKDTSQLGVALLGVQQVVGWSLPERGERLGQRHLGRQRLAAKVLRAVASPRTLVLQRRPLLQDGALLATRRGGRRDPEPDRARPPERRRLPGHAPAQDHGGSGAAERVFPVGRL